MTAPIAWIVRHPADTPQTRPAVYFSAADAERHAAEYAGAVVVPLGDVAAARADERERAAKVCEERMTFWQRDDGRVYEDEMCAAAIRAMPPSP